MTNVDLRELTDLVGMNNEMLVNLTDMVVANEHSIAQSTEMIVQQEATTAEMLNQLIDLMVQNNSALAHLYTTQLFIIGVAGAGIVCFLLYKFLRKFF